MKSKYIALTFGLLLSLSYGLLQIGSPPPQTSDLTSKISRVATPNNKRSNPTTFDISDPDLDGKVLNLYCPGGAESYILRDITIRHVGILNLTGNDSEREESMYLTNPRESTGLNIICKDGTLIQRYSATTEEGRNVFVSSHSLRDMSVGN